MTESLGYTGPAEALVGYYADRKPRPSMFQWRTACRLCGGPLNKVLDLGPCPLANEYFPADRRGEKQDTFPVILAQCVSCEHVQTQTIVNPERLYSEYSYTSGIAASFRDHLSLLATQLWDSGQRTIVDIGSNDGTLLRFCREAGMVGIGVDPARNLAAEASARGELTIPAFFNVQTARDLRKILGREPAVVTCLNAMAHTDGLRSIAEGVRELIGETGTFIFEVAYLRDLLEKNEIGSLYHEHISHWCAKSAVSFLKSCGLEITKIERLSIQGGSIRGYARARATGEQLAAVEAFVAEEAEALKGKLEQWPSRVQAERDATMAMLAPYRGKLAIYGAPARLTTWAYAMGLKADDVVCVFDDEPRKIGRLTPGLQYPIVPSSELMARNPEAILISAWPYAREIQARFPGYRGKWMVPMRETKEG